MAATLEVRPIEFDSREYHAARRLREEFLRRPLGLTLTAHDLAEEDQQHHFGLYADDGALIGGVIGKPLSDVSEGVQIRQMVVHQHHRRHGLGTRLLLEAERALQALGYRQSVLFARDEAAPFYERCGYQRTGEQKTLIGLAHLRMEKPLVG